MRPGNIYNIFVMLSAPRLIACLPYLSESNKKRVKNIYGLLTAGFFFTLHFFRNTSIKRE